MRKEPNKPTAGDSLLGRTLNDLADEICEGRADAIAGVRRMASAYAEGLRRFSNAEDFFRRDPRTRWISRTTHDMLLMVDAKDLDPRVVLIPEQKLAGFIKELPFDAQQNLLDRNPYVTVVDAATGKAKEVSYIDVSPRQTDVAWDREKRRFRTAAEQRRFLERESETARVRASVFKPYSVCGNVVRFQKGCELGRNQVIELCKAMRIDING